MISIVQEILIVIKRKGYATVEDDNNFIECIKVREINLVLASFL
jgi:hypothetical protein